MKKLLYIFVMLVMLCACSEEKHKHHYINGIPSGIVQQKSASLSEEFKIRIRTTSGELKWVELGRLEFVSVSEGDTIN